MKIGIFADSHGNIYAFEKIWKALKKEFCDYYFFLGDICGYYYYQNEIIEILKSIKNLISIKGNHDDIFLRMLNDDNLKKAYTKKYGKSSKLLKRVIKKDNLDFLKKLPSKQIIDNYKIAIFHGSPWDYLNEYIYPTDSLNRFTELPHRFVFLGHTHYPMDRTIKHIKIINPGSCGQPRDYNQPSYAILDFESGEVEFKRIEYNPDLMTKDVIKHKEQNLYLLEVLTRKKASYA